jgi:hypothetical protein
MELIENLSTTSLNQSKPNSGSQANFHLFDLPNDDFEMPRLGSSANLRSLPTRPPPPPPTQLSSKQPFLIDIPDFQSLDVPNSNQRNLTASPNLFYDKNTIHFSKTSSGMLKITLFCVQKLNISFLKKTFFQFIMIRLEIFPM